MLSVTLPKIGHSEGSCFQSDGFDVLLSLDNCWETPSEHRPLRRYWKPSRRGQVAVQGCKMEASMIRSHDAIKICAAVLFAMAAPLAQSPDRLPVTDAEKIASALQAGPAFITRDATVLYWPSTPEGEYRMLRKGSSEWTCLPAIAGYPHDAIDSAFKTEPGCYDPIFLRWLQESLAGRTPHIDRIGMSYMYQGLWKYAKDGSSHDFHVGPHVMIVGPNPDEFQGFNRDPTNGMPYVTHLPNRAELFLVMPVRQWNE